jgi:6-hydroxynicotinate 3-monooxygenase
MPTSKLHIAIIGAGIAGLTAAATLLRQGIDVTVFEQAAAFARVGAGIQLTPNAIKVLRGLGLEDGLRATSFAPEVGYNRDWQSGEVTFLHPMGAAIEAAYGAPDLSMHRADLHAALASLVPAKALRFGRKLAGIDRTIEGVRLTFTDGSEALADAVIGADGIHSVVRHTIVGAEKLNFTGRVAYRAVYPSVLLGRAIDDRVKWWGVDRHIVCYKIDPRRDELYFIASTPEPDTNVESWSAMGNRDVLVAAYEGFHPDARLILESTPEVRKWALAIRDPLARWTDDRMIVIGDAAHPMVPYMAQGAGSAMEDAVVLARCLAGVDAGGINAALQRCEASRIDRTTRIQLGAKQNKWMQTAQDTSVDWVYSYDAWNVALAR